MRLSTSSVVWCLPRSRCAVELFSRSAADSPALGWRAETSCRLNWQSGWKWKKKKRKKKKEKVLAFSVAG